VTRSSDFAWRRSCSSWGHGRTRLGEAEFDARRRSAADRELFETLTATIAADRSPRSA
jgi:hypothetical protein